MPDGYAPVRSLMLYLTEDCNLRCTYCFVDKKPRTMTPETARQVVDWYLSRPVSGAVYHLAITFFGGEPFMAMDAMEEVIAYARQPKPNVYKKVAFYATTNGTVASPRVERIIRDSKMELLVSMDGGTEPSRYRPFVSGRSSYDHVARNLPRLVEWSPSVVVRMTFHPGNLDFVGSIRQVLALGAPSVVLSPVVEADWNGHEEALETAWNALADWFIDEARHGRLVPLENTRLLLQELHAARRGAERPMRPCPVGHSTLAVDPDGHVMPCHRFLYRKNDWLGHVTDPKLPPARSQYLHLASRDILGCDDCSARSVCGGGCRVVAMMGGGDLQTGRHPSHCLLMRAHTRAATRIYETLAAEDNPVLAIILGNPRLLGDSLQELITR